jgi:transcriptional regulator with XRE-family HTH domain
MPQKTIESNQKLGNAIKSRRNELNLTIEEAASKAGIGTKTWSRYESGEPIREDKVRGLCKTLNWTALPRIDDVDTSIKVSFDDYRNNEVWSPYLMERFGKYAAISFVIGSEILLDEIDDDLAALSKMPKGSHIGEIPSSFISPIMPEQFLMRYDYEFMWALRHSLIHLRKIAPHTKDMIAHSVVDELILHLIAEESRFLIGDMEFDFGTDIDEDECMDWNGWPYDIFDDMDIVTFLYSDILKLTPDDTYHFDNWFEQQFFVSEKEGETVLVAPQEALTDEPF